MSGANDRQVGGTHYKTGGEEHWDRIYRLFGPGYFIGCATKYIERHLNKGGIEDLRKAQHFLEKLIELEGAEPKETPKIADVISSLPKFQNYSERDGPNYP